MYVLSYNVRWTFYRVGTRGISVRGSFAPYAWGGSESRRNFFTFATFLKIFISVILSYTAFKCSNDSRKSLELIQNRTLGDRALCRQASPAIPRELSRKFFVILSKNLNFLNTSINFTSRILIKYSGYCFFDCKILLCTIFSLWRRCMHLLGSLGRVLDGSSSSSRTPMCMPLHSIAGRALECLHEQTKGADSSSCTCLLRDERSGNEVMIAVSYNATTTNHTHTKKKELRKEGRN